jgi:Dna[CI] antecedent, DciA
MKRLSLPMTEALAQSTPLASLLERVRESEARLDAVRGELPPGLAGQVRAGPLDEAGWTLLVSSGAAAAKLRQCLPRLQQALQAQGRPELAIRVKVHVVRAR